MKVLKIIGKILIYLILGIVLAYNIYNFYQMKVLKKDYVSINGYAALEVISGSMEPTIKIGDMIIINTNDKNYKVGDIITFYDENNSFVTHRIEDIDSSGNITTKGDNNDSIDLGTITKNEIVGKYINRIPTLGYIFKSIRTPFVLAMIFIIGILACVFISYDNKGKIIYTEEEKEYEEFLEYKNKKKKENTKKKK